MRTGQSIRAAIAAFLQSLGGSGYAPATIASRATQLRAFQRWCDVEHLSCLTALDRRALERFCVSIAGTEPTVRRSVGSRANLISAIRALLKWIAERDGAEPRGLSALRRPRLGPRLPQAVLSPGEVDRIMAQPDTATVVGLRDRAVLELAYSTGLRRGELVALDIGDIDEARATVLVRRGKGAKDRAVPVGQRALGWVRRYVVDGRPALARRSLVPARALFLTARGGRMRGPKLTERLRGHIQSAGVDKRGSVHIFRHTMATHLHDGGADIRDIQQMLGHADLSTTAIYTHVSIARLARVHAAAHPAGDGPAGYRHRHTMPGLAYAAAEPAPRLRLIAAGPGDASALRLRLAEVVADGIRELGLTQAACAERCHTSQPVISRIVRGKLRGISVDRLLGYVAALGFDVELGISPRADRFGRKTSPVTDKRE